MENENNQHLYSFWAWFFKGAFGGQSGISQFYDRFLVLHALIALIGFFVFDKIINTLNVIISVFGILFAVTVVWCGNAISLLTTKEINILAQYYSDDTNNPVVGITYYVYKVQTFVLIMFITIFLWFFHFCIDYYKSISFACAIFFSSISIRECWDTISLSSAFCIIKTIIYNKTEQNSKSEKSV